MVSGLVRSVRPHQWVKNSFVFAGALFGRYAGASVTAVDLLHVFFAFCCFCLLSASVYLLNDVVDRERDRQHPVKCKRPIASGKVPVGAALAAAVACVAAAMALAYAVAYREPASWARQLFLPAGLCYLALNIGYSLVLKNLVIIDVLCIALGFVLRVVAGCLAVPVQISPWILVCTLLLALFLGLCKRRHELMLLGDGNSTTRKVLPKYSAELLNQMISETTAAILVAYMLYSFQPHGASSDPRMMLTIPFVIYGVWRYQYMAYRYDLGGSPEVAFRDPLFVLNALVWVAVVLGLTFWR